MNICKRFILILLILSGCVGCDQVTKEVAKQSLQSSATRSWFHDTVRFQYTENTGAFLGLGANLSENLRLGILLILPGIFLCGILAFGLISRRLYRRELLALSFILGGGCSNLFDRLFQNGNVTDFLNIGIGTLRTGIFNLADVMIMLGTGVLIVLSFHHKDRVRDKRHTKQ